MNVKKWYEIQGFIGFVATALLLAVFTWGPPVSMQTLAILALVVCSLLIMHFGAAARMLGSRLDDLEQKLDQLVKEIEKKN